ncbi:MIB [Mytilus edulis]|uniref:MIB n=1 Tax=Mytilus edulis TaxID=6550 RepID=A0A8S3QY91_MYTED|nr:MIB [Mytilus edulis]
MQLGTIGRVNKSEKEVHVQWDKLEEKVNLHDLRLVAATEKRSNVVLISRTIIRSSTVSSMQKKIEQASRVVKKSWIPKEEMPLGTITIVKTLRREVNNSFLDREKEEGSRVVRIAWTSNEESYVGTIVKVNKTKQTARVRWDKQPEEKVKLCKLRLVGNNQTDKIEIGSRVVKKTQTTREEIPFGTIVNIHQSKKKSKFIGTSLKKRVKHSNVTCDECYTYPLRGIRWKCLHCDSYDLCTVCYMADEHNVSHIFSRILSEDSKGEEMPARFDVKLTGYAFALGIQENAEVSLRKNNRKEVAQLQIVRCYKIPSHVQMIQDSVTFTDINKIPSHLDMLQKFRHINRCYKIPSHLQTLQKFRHIHRCYKILSHLQMLKNCVTFTGDVLDEKVLPVIISIRNGGLNEDVLKSSPDVTILTLENGSIEQATEHMTNLKTPWTVRKSETLIAIKNAETTEEISAISEVQSNFGIQALICHVVIGDIKRAVSNSDVIGLIFLALLRKQLYSGAIQLVDTGFVSIRHILVGCQILQNASDDKKNEQIKRETSQRMKLYFTERATLITGFIYDASSSNVLVKNELGESVNHAGRLLVNHGYLEDAIKTENKAFLDNKTVTDILNTMWYGEKKSFFFSTFLCIDMIFPKSLHLDRSECIRTHPSMPNVVGLFIILALVHLLVMPVLMINITAPPLKWLYQKYNLPFMKAFIQMLGYLTFLVVYAFMLLFSSKTFTPLWYSDITIAAWMISLVLNETKQVSNDSCIVFPIFFIQISTDLFFTDNRFQDLVQVKVSGTNIHKTKPNNNTLRTTE